MKQILLAILLFSLINVHAQTNWEKITLSGKVSISFPSKPNETLGTGVKSYVLVLADSTANFICVENDLQVTAGLDEASLDAAMENEESWEQAKSGIMNSMGKDASLVNEERLVFKERQALKLVVNRKTPKGETNILSVLIFTKGSKSYNIIFNSRAGKADEKMKEQFFNSIEIN